jgi:sortase (surface protein transpeptidase)
MADAATDTERASSARRAKGARSGLTTVVLGIVVGVVLIGHGLAQRSDGPPEPPTAASVFADDGAPTADPMERAVPTRVRIPAIGVNAAMMPLEASATGELAVPPPDKADMAGWHDGGVTPGQLGTAVVLGHVDSRDGPAVFYDLGRLRKGATIEVARKDGRTAVFTVYGIDMYDRTSFPSKQVYTDAHRPELRVITCGGTFTPGTGYSSNVVVFARLTASR